VLPVISTILAVGFVLRISKKPSMPFITGMRTSMKVRFRPTVRRR